MIVDIKDISGNIRFSTLPDGKRKFLLMKEDYITVKFNLEEPIFFKLGDYVDCDFGLFEICDIQKPTYNTSTGGYDYELRLDAYYWKWKNKIFKYTPEAGGQEASWNLTASLDIQLGVFLRNLKALGYNYGGKDFEFSISSSVEDKALLMSYDNTNMIDALSMMAEMWECEWWIIGNQICFGRCEFSDPVDFEIGVNVEEMTRSDSQTNYATRIYAFGSTRNIPTNYRPVDESVIVNGVVQKRLMLPVDTPCIDAYEDMTQEEAIEQVVVFDDVYPRRTGTASDITTYTDTVENEDGTETTEIFYRFKDAGVTFSEDYVLEGEELHIVFQSGALNGMDFGVKFNPEGKAEKNEDGSWNPEAQLWEIVANEDYGRKLPADTLIPKAGDTYVLYGWDSTKIAELGLIAAAELELKEKAEAYRNKVKIDPSTYTNKMMSDRFENSDGMNKLLEAGDRVNLINAAYFETGSRQSRIIGFEYNLDIPWDSPVYTVGETASYSRLGEIEDKVDSLTYQGQDYTGGRGSGIYLITTNDKTQPSDRNAYSARRTLAEIKGRSLSCLDDDKAAGHITLTKGGTVENGLIVRLPKQTTPVALMSCLLEEDIDTLIEEDEDALMEIAPVEATDLSFGGLSNVNSSVDSAPVGSLPVKGKNEWSYAAPTLYAGVIDADNMLVPVYDRRIQQMVFIPISAIRGGVTPPTTGFPYTFSFALG